MQLMPETALKMGWTAFSTPAQQLAAGVRYIKHLDEQLPEEITNPKDRIKFILAAYNIGIGRGSAGQGKSSKIRQGPEPLDGNVEYYLHRRSNKDPYAKTDTVSDAAADYTMEGFCRRHHQQVLPL